MNLPSRTAALARDVARRHKANGQELDQAGVTYLLFKADAGWEFAAIALHDPDGVSRSGQPNKVEVISASGLAFFNEPPVYSHGGT